MALKFLVDEHNNMANSCPDGAQTWNLSITGQELLPLQLVVYCQFGISKGQRFFWEKRLFTSARIRPFDRLFLKVSKRLQELDANIISDSIRQVFFSCRWTVFYRKARRRGRKRSFVIRVCYRLTQKATVPDTLNLFSNIYIHFPRRHFSAPRRGCREWPSCYESGLF